MTGRTRLLLAAALCLVGLGLGWSSTDGDLQANTTFLPGSCTTDYDGYLSCTAGTVGVFYTPGFGTTGYGFADDARVVLVPAALALGWAARGRTRRSERVAEVVAVALAVLSLRAGADGQASAALVGAVATALVVSALRRPAPADAPTGAMPPGGPAVALRPEPVAPRPGGAF